VWVSTGLASGVFSAVFLVGAVTLAIEVIVDAVIADLGTTATAGAGRIPVAVTVIAVNLAVTVVVEAVEE
jgi:hypothetical protein